MTSADEQKLQYGEGQANSKEIKLNNNDELQNENLEYENQDQQLE